MARIILQDPTKKIRPRVYSCPRHYLSAFQTLIQQHLDAGRIRMSKADSASPAFVIPKKDPTVLPRLVIDYRALNANTVKDKFPLPKLDDILDLAGGAQYWGKIDMTNSFFQTRVHPEDIPHTTFTTPMGMDWLVMPMGFCNAPSIHQHCMVKALNHLIGKSCHVYMDDIIIWSQTLQEHCQNCAAVLDALREADLYCSPKKTELVTT
ncbi:DNA/RNA polymerase [Calocera cornea HHB12733]|uniref:DNA/RNA polymerase n=1 Tax=Calocera cornea HHB12733 TaxID=1353952 RepID=A0A165IF34_9BASI|nr:DNA/RNA polymerase [Calocera cornea HHB12733]